MAAPTEPRGLFRVHASLEVIENVAAYKAHTDMPAFELVVKMLSVLLTQMQHRWCWRWPVLPRWALC